MTLANSITLSVNDDGDDGTTPEVDEVYTNLRRTDFRGDYIGENHNSLSRDMMTTYYTPPKPTSIFNGVDKAAVKFTEDVTVENPSGDDTRASGIIQTNVSFPVGMTQAEKTHLVQRMAAFICSADFLLLCEQGHV
jgi:hypothetical protein